MRVAAFLSLLTILFSSGIAELNAQTLTFGVGCREAYEGILELDDARYQRLRSKALAEGEQEEAILLLDHFNDFLITFISESKAAFVNMQKLKDARVLRINKSNLAQHEKNFIQAEILLQSGLCALKFSKWISGVTDIRKATQLLEWNKSKHPDYPYTYKSLGLIHALISTIPSELSWATRLAGMNGSLQVGVGELDYFDRFAKANGDIFLLESAACKAYVSAYLENKPKEGFRLFESKLADYDPSPLITFVQSRLAMKAGQNDAALNRLQALPAHLKKRLPFLYYLEGICRLQRLDLNAKNYFNDFLFLDKGSSYKKECYQKLSWIALLMDDQKSWENYRKLCLNAGNALLDEDKQAHDEMLMGSKPDTVLLKARLLCDGSYADRAYELLTPKMKFYYLNPKWRLEAVYRMGRICQLKNLSADALHYFQDAWDFDLTHSDPMSCNALLQSGLIYETLGDYHQAEDKYRKVLQLKPRQYGRSLHQKAKAGLSRIKK
ncbi:MAG TPA: hypothetical protein PKD32_07680 [Saprospiraceae bacterium]|nr:hypothetical protein [Saprospiraceae bacterium]